MELGKLKFCCNWNWQGMWTAKIKTSVSILTGRLGDLVMRIWKGCSKLCLPRSLLIRYALRLSRSLCRRVWETEVLPMAGKDSLRVNWANKLVIQQFMRPHEIHLVLMRELGQSHLSKTGWPGVVPGDWRMESDTSLFKNSEKRIWDIRGWSASLQYPGRLWRNSAYGSHS